jgi:hypothetical protein
MRLFAKDKETDESRSLGITLVVSIITGTVIGLTLGCGILVGVGAAAIILALIRQVYLVTTDFMDNIEPQSKAL